MANAVRRGRHGCATPLYNRDVVGVLPSQVSAGCFAVPLYVRIRRVARLYRPGTPKSGVARYDLPDEEHTLTLGGVRGDKARPRATDRLSGPGRARAGPLARDRGRSGAYPAERLSPRAVLDEGRRRATARALPGIQPARAPRSARR
jgi:hypothetical protein